MLISTKVNINVNLELMLLLIFPGQSNFCFSCIIVKFKLVGQINNSQGPSINIYFTGVPYSLPD